MASEEVLPASMHDRTNEVNVSVSNGPTRSKLPAPKSKLRMPTVSRINKPDQENDAPPVKKAKPTAPVKTQQKVNKKNPLLTRVAKKKGRRSVGIRQINGGPKKTFTRNGPTSSTSRSSIGSNSTAGSKQASKTTLRPTTSGRQSGGAALKKPAKWDYKGQLEYMTNAMQEQKEALAAEKSKTNMMDDILRRLEALEGEKKEMITQNYDLSGNVQEKEEEISRLRNEIARVSGEKERLKDEHAREIRSLRLDLDDARRDLCKVREERDQFREERSKLEIELHSTKKHLEEEMEKLAGVQLELDNLTTQYQDSCKTVEQQELERKKLLNEVQELKGNIRVFCRVRPPIKNEEAPDHINYDGQAGKSLNVYNHDKECKYSFDKVFDPSATQAEVYEELDQLVQSSLDGFNVCVFAYGQTGSGKTYTMEGPDDMTEETCGVIPRAMKQIFVKCDEQKKFDWEYELFVEHVEIYCETLQDLLKSGNSNEKLEIRTVSPSGRSTIWVSNLSSHRVEKYSDVMKLVTQSKRRRATAATTANDHSSRSHSVFMLKIKAKNTSTGQETESALNLIDLAGSERCGDNGATGIRLKEGKKINGSLTSLSKVISALTNKDSHVPYRNSKLTHLLMNSLGGNSKTLMVVNINPSPAATSETVNTLRFATTVNQCNIGTAQKTVKF